MLSSALQRFKRNRNMQWYNAQFLPGTASYGMLCDYIPITLFYMKDVHILVVKPSHVKHSHK